MGVYLESISEYIYSIGEDKKLKIHDLRKNALVEGKLNFHQKGFKNIELNVGSGALTVLLPDKENKRLFISNRNGQVFIYDIGSVKKN